MKYAAASQGPLDYNTLTARQAPDAPRAHWTCRGAFFLGPHPTRAHTPLFGRVAYPSTFTHGAVVASPPHLSTLVRNLAFFLSPHISILVPTLKLLLA